MSRKKKNKKLNNIGCFILDKSGSMGTLTDQVLSGFEEYLNTLKKKNVGGKFYLTLFDSESIEKPYQGTDLKDVKPLTKDTYRPLGMTPLYDAVVKTVKQMEKEIEDMDDNTAVSVVIMTDGYENDSREYNEKDMSDLVKKLTKKGNWTFAYMGANQDAWAVANKFGISQGNTMSWASTGKGTRSAFSSLANASAQYTVAMAAVVGSGGGGSMLNSKDFFKPEDSK